MKQLSRLSMALCLTALVLIAEDFWAKKQYLEWSEKDATKLLTGSPWAKEVSISLGAPGEGARTGTGGRRGGGTSGEMTSDPAMTVQPGMGNPSGMAEAGGSGGGGGRRGGGGSEMPGGRGTPTLTLYVRWQSALPVREAIVVSKLGREKASSDQAKKFVETSMPYYVVAVVGLPQQMTARLRAENMAELAKVTTLNRKDKDPIVAENVQKLPDDPGLAFLFPRTAAISLDYKEVEFVCKVGTLEVKRKFKLKDMMFGEKLEL